MIQITQQDKKRITDFITESDLDYGIVDNDISKFSVVSSDGFVFYVYSYNEKYIIAKYDKSRDIQGKSCYDYFEFGSIPQILEQLSVYDNSIIKNYWEPTSNSIDVPFDKNSYNDEWVNEFIKDEFYRIEESQNYKFIVYDNPNYKPQLLSPFNTLHEVSTINIKEYTKVEKLHFEIHPVSLVKGKESYFFKLLCNNEEVLKEFINYKVIKKKGLKLLIENLFKLFNS